MKKIVFAITALLLALTAAGCGNPDTAGTAGNTNAPGTETSAETSPSAQLSGEINVYNWGGPYIDSSVLDDFESETGVKVNYSEFQSNEEMYSSLKTGGASYDVIIPSDYMISRLIDEDMLEELDFANIPNYSLIDENWKGLEYDPDEKYSVAYMTGTVGLIYNESMITDGITSWDALWSEAYNGQILMFDNPRDAFGIALKYLGYSQNTTSEAEIREAYDLLAEQKPILQAYVMDQIYDKLEAGEAAIGPYYAGDYLVMRENNPDLRFVRPSEGSNRFVDAMCVPKGANNKANAEAFINYMCRSDVALKNMEEICYASANVEAMEQYGAELAEEDYEIMFPSDETIANCDVFTNLPQETLELYNTLWSELKG